MIMAFNNKSAFYSLLSSEFDCCCLSSIKSWVLAELFIVRKTRSEGGLGPVRSVFNLTGSLSVCQGGGSQNISLTIIMMITD